MTKWRKDPSNWSNIYRISSTSRSTAIITKRSYSFRLAIWASYQGWELRASREWSRNKRAARSVGVAAVYWNARLVYGNWFKRSVAVSNLFIFRFGHVLSDLCGCWRERWLIVKDTWLGYVRPKDSMIRGVILFDHGFEISASLYSSAIQVYNRQRRIVFKCRGRRKRSEWSQIIKNIANRQGR